MVLLKKTQYKQLYFPLLDTTRFIAFIPVFLTHCFITSNKALENENWFKTLTHFLDVGLLGLDYFFVLSSFLITRLIIDEWQRFKSFSFKLFFVRRSLRIWPLYFLMVAIGFMAYFTGLLDTPLPSIFHFVSFTLNLYIAKNGYHFLFFLVFLWSISVEEQFYIFWGVLLNIASKINTQLFKTLIPTAAILLILLSIYFRYQHLDDELTLYFHTLSVTSNFGVGIFIAYISAYSKSFVSNIEHLNLTSICLLGFLLIISISTYSIVFVYPITIIFERLYFSLLFAFVILVLCYSQYVPKIQKFFIPFDYLGKISLGLYFYHGIVLTIFSKLILKYNIASQSWEVIIVNPLIMLILSILLASLSFNYFEKPILALKTRFYKSSNTAP